MIIITLELAVVLRFGASFVMQRQKNKKNSTLPVKINEIEEVKESILR